jgi:hypothetical protein
MSANINIQQAASHAPGEAVVAPAPAASAALSALSVETYLAAILKGLKVAHQKVETLPTLKSTAAALLPLAHAVGGMDQLMISAHEDATEDPASMASLLSLIKTRIRG